MFKKAVDKINGYNGSVDSIPELIVGKKCMVTTEIIEAFGEQWPKIVPIEFIGEDKKEVKTLNTLKDESIKEEIDIEEEIVT